MTDIKSMNKEELKNLMTELVEKPFRAKQIYSWLHEHLVTSYEEMGNIPGKLKEKLKAYPIVALEMVDEQISAIDGTRKYLFRLSDGNVIESVLMRYKHGNSVCISSQVGCKMGCRFCASTIGGWTRNLLPSEMLDQIYRIQSITGERVSNVVVMGTGEPMDNYDNIVRFVHLLSDEGGLNISQRNITVSTCGIVPKIYDLANENMPVNLTISLHFPFDDERKEIMPVAKKYTIKEILAACENYFNKTKRRYIFEYVLIYGKNDTKRHADELIKLLSKRPCHVNLIRLNTVKENDFKAVTDKNAYKFAEYLNNHGISATVRRRMGDDIEGACGQLRRKYIENSFDSEINLI